LWNCTKIHQSVGLDRGGFVYWPNRLLFCHYLFYQVLLLNLG